VKHTWSRDVNSLPAKVGEERKLNKELGRRAQDKGDLYKTLHKNCITRTTGGAVTAAGGTAAGAGFSCVYPFGGRG
jgi:hypothetical protein